ncbi:MAG TPA: ATP-binding protein [Terriglobales bacterium]|jgi:signal transduction histidine kinase|nr:ATP-binding protein [Terriglobales bacterium]
MKIVRDKLVVWSALLLALAQTVMALVAPRSYALTVFGDLVQTSLLVIGMAAMYRNAVRSSGRVRFFWGLMAAGFALWTTSQLMWTYYEVLARHEVPNPFLGDVVVFIHLVPMMGALTLQLQSAQDKRSLELGSLDVVLLLFWWLYLYVFAVIPWQYVAFDVPRYGNSFNTLYLAEHLLFLAGVGILWLKTRDSWRIVYGNLMAAALLYGFGFYAADVAIDLHRYYTGSAYDIPLVTSMAAFVWVGVIGGQIKASEQAPSKTTPSPWAGRLAMLAMLSMPVLALWQEFRGDAPPSVRHFRLLVSLVAILLLGVLVFVKQHLLTRQLAELLERSEESLENYKSLQKQLLQSEKLASLGQLVAGAAHEINNPLTAILGFSEMLALEKTLTPTQEDFVEKIRRQAQRTKELVSNLLDFARQTPGQKTMVDVNALVQTVLKLSEMRMQRRQVRVELDLGLRVPSLAADRNQLLQVCLHLVRNAVDAMEPRGGGVLRIVTRAQEEDVIIEFSDTGEGLKEPERVFDPFYTTKGVNGTGLGLSAAYGIVQDHHGKITCYNRPEGGATFEVRLPAAPNEKVAPATPPSAVDVESGA